VLEQNDLPKGQHETLVNLIFSNIDPFATDMHDLVGTDVVKMEIDTGNARPVRKIPYRQSPEMQRRWKGKFKRWYLPVLLNPVTHRGRVLVC